MRRRLRSHAVVHKHLRDLEEQVAAGKMASRAAAYQLAMHLFAHGVSDDVDATSFGTA